MEDIITIKFTVEADFDTLQEIRRDLGEKSTQDFFSGQVEAIARTRLEAAIQGEFALTTSVKVPAYRKTKKGPRTPLPQVKNGVLTWFDPYEELTNTVGKIGSKYWLAWLEDPQNKSFSYTSKHGATFTAIKRKDGVWYAHKRLGKLRRKYLGKGEKLTRQKMDQVAFELAQRELV